MGWFNLGSERLKGNGNGAAVNSSLSASLGASLGASMPADRNCSDDDYEKYIWTAFVNCHPTYWKDVVRWKVLERGFYEAVLKNGDVIFFIANENSSRYLKAAEAKFDTEKSWSKEFARRLNYAMNRLSLNQSDLSERTGISQSSLSAYLNCKKIPSAYTLISLANALDTTVDFLSVFS